MDRYIFQNGRWSIFPNVNFSAEPFGYSNNCAKKALRQGLGLFIERSAYSGSRTCKVRLESVKHGDQEANYCEHKNWKTH